MSGALCVQCENLTVYWDDGLKEMICYDCDAIQGEQMSWPSSPSADDSSVFSKIEEIGDRMGLVPYLIRRAVHVAVCMDGFGLIGNNKDKDAFAAATLHIACNEFELTRSLTEFGAASGANLTRIGREKAFIVNAMRDIGQRIDLPPLRAEHLVRRWASGLGMNQQDMQDSYEVARLAQMLGIRRVYTSIAAASIYVISQLTGQAISMDELSCISGVGGGTIRATYRDMYPHARRLIPERFTDELVATLSPTA